MTSVARCLVAEWFATFVLIFGGTGVVVFNSVSNGGAGLVGVAMTWGLLVMVMAYTVGPVSGAHMNPAVTIGLATAGKFPWRLVAPYILAQCAGAFTGSGLLKALTSHVSSPGLAATRPFGPEWVPTAFVLEVWLTGVLVYTVLALSMVTTQVSALGGLIVGGVIALEVLVGGPITGASMNPARSLAPAVLTGEIDVLWLYITAPILGSVIAVQFWKYLHLPNSATKNRKS